MNTALLSSIAAATATAGFLYVGNSADASELVAAGLIEVNTGMQNPANPAEAAARVTEAGNKFLADNTSGSAATNMGPTGTANTQAPVVASEKPTFERVRMPMPDARPRAAGAVDREEKYPFSELLPFGPDGMDAIFVAPTEKMPDPATSLVSAVSAANRRYAKVTGEKLNKKGKVVKTYEQRRTFKVFPSTDANRPGAWIGRIDDGSKQNLA